LTIQGGVYIVKGVKGYYTTPRGNTMKVFTAQRHAGVTDTSIEYHVSFEHHNPDMGEKATELSGTLSLQSAIEKALAWGFEGTLHNDFGDKVGTVRWDGTFFLA